MDADQRARVSGNKRESVANVASIAKDRYFQCGGAGAASCILKVVYLSDLGRLLYIKKQNIMTWMSFGTESLRL